MHSSDNGDLWGHHMVQPFPQSWGDVLSSVYHEYHHCKLQCGWPILLLVWSQLESSTASHDSMKHIHNFQPREDSKTFLHTTHSIFAESPTGYQKHSPFAIPLHSHLLGSWVLQAGRLARVWCQSDPLLLAKQQLYSFVEDLEAEVAQDICLQTQSPASQVSINCHHLSHTFLHEFRCWSHILRALGLQWWWWW